MNETDRIDALKHEIALISFHRERSWSSFSDWEKHFWSAHVKAKELEVAALENYRLVRDRIK